MVIGPRLARMEIFLPPIEGRRRPRRTDKSRTVQAERLDCAAKPTERETAARDPSVDAENEREG